LNRRAARKQPRRHRMKRAARLASARHWLSNGGFPRVGPYAKRYGVDKYTAYQELASLGVDLAESEQMWAVRPPPVPKRRPAPPNREPLLPDLIEWGGEPIYVVGWSDSGFPYGLMGEDLAEFLRELESDGIDWRQEVYGDEEDGDAEHGDPF
jgi:hypothetical protein